MQNTSSSWASLYRNAPRAPKHWPENFIVRVFQSRKPVSFLRNYDFSTQSVLDLGCGQGRHVPFLESLGFGVTGLEVSDDLIVDLKAYYPENRFIRGSNTEIPLSDGSLDYVVAVNSIYYLDTAETTFDSALSEVWRVLKPGGCLVCSFVGWKHSLLEGARREGDLAVAGSDYRTFEHGVVFRPVWEGEALDQLLSPFAVYRSGEILEQAKDHNRHLFYVTAYKDE